VKVAVCCEARLQIARAAEPLLSEKGEVEMATSEVFLSF